MSDEDLLALLTARETALLRPAVRIDATAVADLLHPQAEEVGRSGRCYDRLALGQLLAAGDPREVDAVRASGFSLLRLADGAALLRYRSERDGQATWRSSLWQLHEGQWRLRFHQGTAAA